MAVRLSSNRTSVVEIIILQIPRDLLYQMRMLPEQMLSTSTVTLLSILKAMHILPF